MKGRTIIMVNHTKAIERDVDKCAKSPTGEHVWNYAPRPDNCRLGTCRYCEQQRVFEGALTKPAPVKPETIEKVTDPAPKWEYNADVIVRAEKSVERETPVQLKTGGIAESYHAEVLRRLRAGDKPCAIAKDIGYAPSSVYAFKYKRSKEVFAKEKAVGGILGTPVIVTREYFQPAVLPEAPPMKSLIKKPTQVYNTNQGNIMSQMARLGRGEIRTRAAGPVITRYKEMLEDTLRAKESEVKELKAKISVADEALRELDVIHQGEKSAVDKVLAVVR